MNRIYSIVLLANVLLLGLAGCGSGYSVPFTQNPPPPPPAYAPFALASISPSTALAGSPDLQLTITGGGFNDRTRGGTRVVWRNGTVDTFLSENITSDTELTALVPSALLLQPATAQVFLQKYDHIEGVVSLQTGPLPFVITAPQQASLSLIPAADILGPHGVRLFSLQVNGISIQASWQIEEGPVGGSINSDGFYSAPANPGSFHVIGASLADPNQIATASVSVVTAGFRNIAPMNAARTGHSAVLLPNSKVLIVGGDSRMELFDPATNSFSLAISSRPVSSVVRSVLLLDGRVLFLGLSQGDGTPRFNAVYDPASGDVTPVADMLQPRAEYTATLLTSGKVLVIGGALGGGAAEAFNSAELFDPSTGTFSATGSLLSARADHTATLLSSGLVLVAGGWNGHRADAPDDPPWDPLVTELFDPTTGSFRPTGSMSSTRIRHTAVRLADGSVLVMGGIPAMQNLHSQPPYPSYAEVYNPPDGAFVPADNIVFPYDSYTATLLTDGRVLIVGGQLSNSPISSAYLIDTARGTAEPTGSLVTPRKGHTATLLNDGRVLITGGTDASGSPVATAEMYP